MNFTVDQWNHSFQDNDIEKNPAHYGEKSVVAASFTGILKNKIFRYLTLISKNMYIDKLFDIVKVKWMHWYIP